MSNQIDILIAVDAVRLMEEGLGKGSTPDAPCFLGGNYDSDKYITMVCQPKFAPGAKYSEVNQEGHSELNVNAVEGDTIVWSITTFDGMRLYSANLYRSAFHPADGVSCLSYVSQRTINRLPALDNVNTLSPGPITQYKNQLCWVSGQIEKTEKIQYTLGFQITDNKDGSARYFTWDPFFDLKIG